MGASAEPAWQAFTGGQPIRLSDGVAHLPDPQRRPPPTGSRAAPAEAHNDAELPPAHVRVALQAHAPKRATLAISDQADDVRRCYQRALTRVPDLSGDLTVSLDIGRDGHARGEVLIDETGDWQLVACVQEATALWLIPDTTGTLRLTVRLRPA